VCTGEREELGVEALINKAREAATQTAQFFCARRDKPSGAKPLMDLDASRRAEAVSSTFTWGVEGE
jgi:hypothetical protein